MRADRLRETVRGVAVGGHLLEVHRVGCGGLRWQLCCGGCLALLCQGNLDPDGPVLAGASFLPAAGGHGAVSWACGWLPAGAGSHVQVVFGRGLRRPVLAPAHRLGGGDPGDGVGGGWAAAAPGRAWEAVAVGPGVSAQRRVDRLAGPSCAGLPVGSG